MGAAGVVEFVLQTQDGVSLLWMKQGHTLMKCDTNGGSKNLLYKWVLIGFVSQWPVCEVGSCAAQ